jgi:predicted nucleic acid-binding protein
MFVLDASVTLAHALAEPEFFESAQRIVRALAKETALVPAMWSLEVAAVLLKREREGRLSKKEVDELLERWNMMPVKVDTTGVATTFTDTVSLARKHHIAVYDASYLELARRHRLPIATFDSGLREAAKREEVGSFTGA